MHKTCIACRTLRNKNPIKTDMIDTKNVLCECCGANITRKGLWQHKQTNDCKQLTYWKDKVDITNPNINFWIYFDNTYYPYYIDTLEHVSIEGINPNDKLISHTRKIKRPQ